MKKIIMILGVVLFSLCVFGLTVREAVDMVKKANFYDYPAESYATVGEAFDYFFSRPRWNAFVSKNDYLIVEFTGTAIEDDEGYEVVIQFTVDTKKGSWYVNYFEVDGKQQELSLLSGLLEYIFVAFNYN